MISPEEFGKRLRKLRHNRGLTLTQLTERTGISTAYLSDMERGKRGSPTATTLVNLADALGVSVDELLGRNGDQQSSIPAWAMNLSPEWRQLLEDRPELSHLMLRVMNKAKKEDLPEDVLYRLLEAQIESFRILRGKEDK